MTASLPNQLLFNQDERAVHLSMSAEEEQILKLQRELLDAEPAAIIANHAYGLFELAGLYLGATPPRLADASLAIDAFAGLLSAVEDRLGDIGQPLQDGLRQLQAAFVQVAKLDHPTPSTPSE
jgi:hypothetical protein